MNKIDWKYPLYFGADLDSPICSLWLGWWLITWSNPNTGIGRLDLCVTFQPGL